MKFTEISDGRGSTLEELAKHLETRSEAQYLDVLLSSIGFVEDGEVEQNGSGFLVTSVAVRAICRKLQVPFHYIANAPTDIAVENLNYFLPQSGGNVRMVVEGGTLVGVVPESYEPVRHDLLIDALERSAGSFQLHGWRCGNEGLFMRYTSPEFTFEPREGDELRAGVDVSNPDCDRGRGLDVTGAIFRLICSNGAVIPEVTFRRRLKSSGWRKPEELALHAVGYFEDACRETVSLSGVVSSLVETPIRTFDPEEEEECKREIRPALKIIRCNGSMAIPLAEALRPEEDTLFGFYNAITRLGRDAAEPRLQRNLERCGYRVVEKQGELAEVLAV